MSVFDVRNHAYTRVLRDCITDTRQWPEEKKSEYKFLIITIE